ncbi:MAG: TonB family protein [Terriglobales bacterium]
MWPHSLLFSSDEEASRALSHAFRDLEFEVETCPEIFSAVEKITRRSFDVVVSDWNEGLEAVFLLKTVRELKANHSAFTIAVADAEASAAAREAGADLVLGRPLIPDEIKYALLTCDSFLVQMKSCLPGIAPSSGEGVTANPESRAFSPSEKEAIENILPERRTPNPSPRLRAWPSPPPPRREESVSPMVAAEEIFDNDQLYRSRIRSLFQAPEPSFSSAEGLSRKTRRRVLPGLAIAVAFLSVGYVFSEPLRGQGTTSVARICARMLEHTQAWLHQPDRGGNAAPAVQVAENISDPQFGPPGRAVSRIRITPVRDPFSNNAVAKPADPPPPAQIAFQPSDQQQAAAAAASVRIPDSLTTPVQSASMRSVTRIAPSILAAIEPVSLSEDLSRRLVLQKILPHYPEQAVKARLQGPVVLQAWIGRDGSIQDLKLVRGSFLLGQAAYRAVKQWRYQPYLVNGCAVEAETLVTVDFRLP